MSERVFVNLGVGGGPIFVYVKDGKIIRVRPMVFDENEDVPTWTIEAKGRNFFAPRKVTVAPFGMTERARVYSEDRIKYPLKRIGFDPNGDRHPETRGKAGYGRISWDEALDIVADEMKRVRTTYGPAAIFGICSSHHNSGVMGIHRSTFYRFMKLLGFTEFYDNPDSWEGWQWGSVHTWGFYWRMGPPEQFDLLEDALKNTDLLVFWSDDPDTNRGNYAGQETAIWRLWLKELGKKMIFIDPFCNFTAAIMADKWIAPRPGTDAAMAMAIAYVWIKESTYDKDYLATHTIGFGQFKKHIMGEDDGIPKTPKWAEGICDVAGRTITALAEEWAAKRTMLAAGMRGGMGGACRQAYGHEWARLMVLLQAMQGLGKPGVNIWGATMGAPIDAYFRFPGFEQGGIMLVGDRIPANPTKQHIYRTLFPDSILNPPTQWLSPGWCTKSIDQQFIPYIYPEKGSPEVRMLYRYGGSFIGTMTEGNKWVSAFRSPKLEFIVNQDCWWCNETRFADIILPACTNLERNDIAEFSNCGYMSPDTTSSCNHRIIVYQQKCIEPVGESRSDYQIFADLAERMGIREEYTEGRSEEDWIKKMFDWSDLPKSMSYEEFKKKGYFLVPLPKPYKSTPALRWFYEGRECDTPDFSNPKRNTEKAKELGTYSGKIEFVSHSLKAHFPNDEERPPMPRYIPSWEGHTSELAQKYPLQLISPHPRFSHHTHYDHVQWIWEIPHQRMFKDGYYWWIVRIHPLDASTRGISDRDIVKLYNDRGTVLGMAYVTERIRPGVIHSYEASAKYEPIASGKPYSVDKGGCVNILTASRMMSRNVPGFAPNSCLVEVSKWEAREDG